MNPLVRPVPIRVRGLPAVLIFASGLKYCIKLVTHFHIRVHTAVLVPKHQINIRRVDTYSTYSLCLCSRSSSWLP
jgi:hypothetical protein